MTDISYAESISNEKAAAKKILEMHAANMPADPIEAVEVHVDLPIVRIAELTLRHIQEHGGKVQASFIAQLSAADKLEELRADSASEAAKRAGSTTENVDRHANNAIVLATLADGMLTHGLVELPLVARGRGRG